MAVNLYEILRKMPPPVLRFCVEVYIQFKRRTTIINVSLLIILIAIAAHRYISQQLNLEILEGQGVLQIANYIHSHQASLAKYLEMARDALAIVGILIAGLWTYYQFIKGRTFKPKLKIDINLQDVLSGFAIVRCKLENVGKIGIRPNFVRAKLYRGVNDGGKIQYVQFDQKENILEDSTFNTGERFFLEPQDQLQLDFEVFVKPYLQGEGEPNVPIMLVRLAFVDSNYFVWQQSSILALESKSGS
jgi:hypothetical protein